MYLRISSSRLRKTRISGLLLMVRHVLLSVMTSARIGSRGIARPSFDRGTLVRGNADS